jgi:UDP-N-acetylmuramoyl-tripeptide--D-alanyl-D-alanine ligase
MNDSCILNINTALEQFKIKVIQSFNNKFESVSYFPRQVKKNGLFVVVQHFDWNGFDFIGEAIELGVTGIVVNETELDRVLALNLKVDIYSVTSTHDFIEHLAIKTRDMFKGQVIAVVGSVGKTQTLLGLKQILSTQYKVQSDDLGRNNFWAICEQLISLKNDTDILLLEIGARKIGEIEYLSQISKPTKALLVNIQNSHLKYLDDFRNVVILKSEILKCKSVNKFYINAELKKLLNVEEISTPITFYGVDNYINVQLVKYENFKSLFKIHRGLQNFELQSHLIGPHAVQILNGILTLAEDLGMDLNKIINLYTKEDIARPSFSLRWVRDIKNRHVLFDGRTNTPESIINFMTTMKNFGVKFNLFFLSGVFDLGDRDFDFLPLLAGPLAELDVLQIVYMGRHFEDLRNLYISNGGKAHLIKSELSAESMQVYTESISKDENFAVQGAMFEYLYRFTDLNIPSASNKIKKT